MLPEAGAFELIFLAMVALIVVGPKDLPVLLRKVGQFTAKMRGLASEFRSSFDEMARQSELDELRKEVEALRTGQFASAALPGVDEHLRDIDASLRDAPPATIERQGTAPLPVLNAPLSTADGPRFTDDLDAEPLPPFDGPPLYDPAGEENWREEPRPPPVVRADDGPRLTDDVEAAPALFDGPAGEEGYREETPRAAPAPAPIAGAARKPRAGARA